MEEAVEEHILSGFDPESEPQVRRTAAGRLWLGIEFLPPTWAPEEDFEHTLWHSPWADFDKRFASAIGVPAGQTHEKCNDSRMSLWKKRFRFLETAENQALAVVCHHS